MSLPTQASVAARPAPVRRGARAAGAAGARAIASTLLLALGLLLGLSSAVAATPATAEDAAPAQEGVAGAGAMGDAAEGDAADGDTEHEIDGLRRLAERLVGVWGDPGPVRVELAVGTLPPEAVFPVPDVHLLGSVARREGEALVSVNAVFDAPARTPEALARVREAFEAEGWTVLVDDPMVGFVGTQVGFFGRACGPVPEGGADRPLVYFSLSPVTGGPTDLRMDYSPAAWDGACVPMDGFAASFAPLPTLTAPEGSTVVAPALAHGPDEATAVATIRGTSEVDAVAAHYEEQLAEAGWEPTEERQQDAARVRSVWTRVAAERSWVAVLALERPVLAGPVVASLAIVPADGP